MSNKNKIFFELVRYCAGGSIGALINILVAYFFTSIVGIYYMYSYIIASIINYIFNFYYHRSVTFNTKDKVIKRAALYYGSNILLGLVALATTYILTSVFGVQYLVSGLMSSILVAVINYIFSKFITFSHKIK